MQFKNLETGNVIEVNKNDVERIEKLKGYPDKFEILDEKVEVQKENKDFKEEVKPKDNKSTEKED